MRARLLLAAALVAASSSAGAQAPSTIGLQRDPRIAAALGDISPARLRALDSALVAFGTRHTMSDTLSSTRGIGAARRWIHAQLTRASTDCGGCLRVEFDTGSAVVGRSPERPTVDAPVVAVAAAKSDRKRVVGRAALHPTPDHESCD